MDSHMKYDNTWTAAVVLAGGIGCGKHPREVSIREVQALIA